jgi:hypothetical protein
MIDDHEIRKCKRVKEVCLLIFTDIQMPFELVQHNILFFYLCGFLVVKLCHYYLLVVKFSCNDR